MGYPNYHHFFIYVSVTYNDLSGKDKTAATYYSKNTAVRYITASLDLLVSGVDKKYPNLSASLLSSIDLVQG